MSGFFGLLRSIAGALKVGTIIGVGAATPATTGAGITFPSTQYASSDANTLDDYEEGTWAPVITFGGASVGITYSYSSATYTKIGRTVKFNCNLVMTSKGSSVGNVLVAGLPFTCQVNAHYAGCVNAGFMAAAVGDTSLHSRVLAGTATVDIRKMVAGSLTMMTEADFTNNSVVYLSGNFEV